MNEQKRNCFWCSTHVQNIRRLIFSSNFNDIGCERYSAPFKKYIIISHSWIQEKKTHNIWCVCVCARQNRLLEDIEGLQFHSTITPFQFQAICFDRFHFKLNFIGILRSCIMRWFNQLNLKMLLKHQLIREVISFAFLLKKYCYSWQARHLDTPKIHSIWLDYSTLSRKKVDRRKFALWITSLIPRGRLVHKGQWIMGIRMPIISFSLNSYTWQLKTPWQLWILKCY